RSTQVARLAREGPDADGSKPVSVFDRRGEVGLHGPSPLHGVVLRDDRLPSHLPLLLRPNVRTGRRVRQLPPAAAAPQDHQ
ncbi:unnamed protein product, partial [Ectocarpus sp. 12 AP-2014]